VKFGIKDTTEELLVKGISETGLLILENKEKALREVDVKEVKWLI
jgi:hypothetical protein